MEHTTEKELLAVSSALPIIRHEETMFFADLRLREFRDVNNPHNCVDFVCERGQRMRRENGVIMCSHCGTAAIVSPASDKEKLRCVQCFSLTMPLFCL